MTHQNLSWKVLETVLSRLKTPSCLGKFSSGLDVSISSRLKRLKNQTTVNTGPMYILAMTAKSFILYFKILVTYRCMQ